MCGLLFTLRYRPTDPDGSSSNVHNDITSAFLQQISHRGPDAQQTHVVSIPISGGSLELSFSAAVLGLRGPLTPQPVIGKRGILGWNGQVFEGMQGDGNDTAWLVEKLEAGEGLRSLLSHVEGPYAMYYYEFAARTLHVHLDPLHRRSLLRHIPTKSSTLQTLIFASARPLECAQAGIDMELVESGWTIRMDNVRVDADGILDVSKAMSSAAVDKGHSNLTEVAPINTSLPGPSRTLTNGSLSISNGAHDEQISAFIDALAESVKLRVDNIPPPVEKGAARLGILFSGGIDCTMVAFLAHRFVPADEPIDLLNVAFENPRSLQAAANVRKEAELRLAKLQKKNAKTAPSELVESSLTKVDKGKGRAIYDVPDRLTAREAVEELVRVCPGREWRLVEVDVTYEECMSQKERVKGLMYPADTEMDLSLALPLFFASRGTGVLRIPSSEHVAPYQSRAKVLLSGLGADEQLGGYSRHRRAFERESWRGLIDEIQMDISRLPSRNLSRDDRIISSNARDARYPYLSLSFIRYLSELPVEIKCDPRLPEGDGDKVLLRRAALSVGLSGAASRKKRAMQFGTRSAKMTADQGKGRGGGDRKVE